MPKEETLRVLVVDDSALYRKIVQRVLEEIPDVSVVGIAQNGRIALAKAAQLSPDVITLDIEMPEMGGLEALSHLNRMTPRPGVIILSTHSIEGARVTLKALDLGAFDFIPKPLSRDLAENHDLLKKSLSTVIAAFRRVRHVQDILQQSQPSPAAKEVPSPFSAIPDIRGNTTPRSSVMKEIRAVAIGISTGGPAALPRVLTKLPAACRVPIFIVQHMPPLFTQALAAKLDSVSAMTVKEAEDVEKVREGVVYLAPGGMHMAVASGPSSDETIIRVVDAPPLNNCKPSVDHLFFSIAEHYHGHSLGVIMTGMGFDGTNGLKRMKEEGALILAQDEASSVVYSMPRRPVEEGIVDLIVPLDNIADEICRLLD